jgi:hypothetical protein
MTGTPYVHDLADALDAVDTFARRFVVFPSSAARDAFVLWIGHAHAIDAFESTPRLYLASAEKQSGKTRATEVAELLVPRPLPAVNTTVAALFRSIGANTLPPTIILDEVDTIFGPKAPDNAEDLRGVLNAGHRRGKPMLRCVGPTHEVAEFPVFAPVILAGIGKLPDTIMDRSVVLNMRRRAANEHVDAFRQREAEGEARPIADALAAHAKPMVEALDGWYPVLPNWLTDRPGDVWEPLIGVADIASPTWGKRARDAAEVLCNERADDDASLGVRLLTEIQQVIDADMITTEELISRLSALEESPWGEWKITARWLAGHLRPFDIRSKNVRIAGRQCKGYGRHDFLDAWNRYLPTVPSQASQGHDQQVRDDASVPGTDPSVPRPTDIASDQHRDGGTDGTDIRIRTEKCSTAS